MHRLRLVWVLCTVLLFFPGCNENTPDTQTKYIARKPDVPLTFSAGTATRMDLYFDSLQQRGQLNGNVLLFHNDSIFMNTYGYRELGKRDSLRLTDAFQLASVSKTITSYATLLLLDRGLLNLDSPLENLFLEFPYPGVTVRMLLNHRSGLGNYAYVTDSLWGMPDSLMCHDDFECLVLSGNLPIYYRPDRKYNYCNTNYALLASIIERKSGLSYAAFLEKEIFGPLGMEQAFVVNSTYLEADTMAVKGHYPNGEQKRYFYLDPICGDKGIYASVLDMYKFYQELKNPKLLDPEWVKKAMAPETKAGAPNRFYGLGWRIKPLEDQQDTIVYHNGWWRGFRTYFWLHAKQDKGAIILTNWAKGRYLNQDEILGKFSN